MSKCIHGIQEMEKIPLVFIKIPTEQAKTLQGFLFTQEADREKARVFDAACRDVVQSQREEEQESRGQTLTSF